MSNDIELDDLTVSQRAALGQLQSITNGADIPSEIAILSSVGWDVQRAASAIFDAPTRTPPRPKFEPMHIDDSASSPRPSRIPFFSRIISLLFTPLTLLLRLLRLPLLATFPRLSLASFTNPRSNYRSLPMDPTSIADRFVRELEDETGAVTVSRARREVEDEAGPSTAAIPLFDSGRRLLPDFFLGSYDSALEVAKKEAKMLCVVLLSAEHDDTAAFKRDVLVDSEFVRTVTENEIIVWAGDVREAEAYQASLKLHATTYPFVAFIALQPRLRPSGQSSSQSASSSGASLTILSRLPQASPLTANIIVEHITTTILPRTQPFLGRLQSQARVRETDRMLREEQDRAYRAAERADGERILRRREEEAERERLRNEERLRKEREEEQRRLRREREEREKEEGRKWRVWARRQYRNGETGTGVRIGVRLPDGKRVIRIFGENEDVGSVYAWVDGIVEPELESDEGDGTEPRVGSDRSPWPFSLSSSFPRMPVPYAKGMKVRDIEALMVRGGASLVVEGWEKRKGADDGEEGSDEDEE